MTEILVKIEGRKTEIEINGEKSDHKTAFIKRMTVNDLLLYLDQPKELKGQIAQRNILSMKNKKP